ncbi:hypothetical protein [Xanthomonas hortorum]|uniref:hypothetical protein n=1 Tax=Xanthomonas hortorum TaxID=56454 RepID=UPI0015D642A7|nr:hypothetical protein [Xanthomonas hortorum]MCE4360022.1 hypothetical protein [Xanthomonas hortorum pv. taraxaci]NMI53835.1 hypothetical protein [Xanthomonas hortorum pv. taraxaci]
MSDPQQISALEASQLAYDVFIFTVETLSRSPEDQCEAMGDYNTAWELRDDALAGHYLIGSGLLTDQQESAILTFLAAVHPVPVNDMPSGSGRAPNLTAMQHPAWELVRSLSKDLLETLASTTQANRAFLELQANAP